MTRHQLLATAVALVVAWPAVPAEPAAEAQAPVPASPTDAEAPRQPGAWPRELPTEEGLVVVYQPQLEKLEGVRLSGRAAVSWTPTGKAPVFGVFWFVATVQIDKDEGTVDVETFEVTRVRSPGSTPDTERRAAAFLTREIPKWDLGGSLEELTAALAAAEAEARTIQGIQATPPRILVSKVPAVLVVYDGAPVARAIEGTSLERIVNTPMLVLRDAGAARLYLTDGHRWFEAAEPRGPWSPVAAPSPAVKAWFEANPPPRDDDGPAAPAGRDEPAPQILVATEPTELLLFDGEPNYVPVTGEADLLHADNCDGKVLVHVPTGETYFLVAGRWFKARSLAGPWAAVRPDRLPPAFSRIPEGSVAAPVRTFVAGTEEAREALADTQIPQTAAVKRDRTLQVTYDGEPRFKAIEGTRLAYAVNTPFSVIQDSGRFWACHEAVWYVAPAPRGPWAVSATRPPSIDAVPPSAPVYNTRYVYVYQSTPSVVYVGYLPGYRGVYPYYGAVVYGTGWHYPPYLSPHAYYPRPATFGVHMTYSPWTGFGVGVSYGTPFLSVGIHFGGHHGWYGPPGYRRPVAPPYGYRPPPPGYRPAPASRPSWAGARPPPAGPGRLPAPGVRPPPTRDGIYRRPGDAGPSRDRPSGVRRPAAPAQRPNDVFGDRTGQVYRRDQGGGWDRHTGQGWQPSGDRGGPPGSGKAKRAGPPRAGGAPHGLDRDAAARNRAGKRR